MLKLGLEDAACQTSIPCEVVLTRTHTIPTHDTLPSHSQAPHLPVPFISHCLSYNPRLIVVRFLNIPATSNTTLLPSPLLVDKLPSTSNWESAFLSTPKAQWEGNLLLHLNSYLCLINPLKGFCFWMVRVSLVPSIPMSPSFLEIWRVQLRACRSPACELGVSPYVPFRFTPPTVIYPIRSTLTDLS